MPSTSSKRGVCIYEEHMAGQQGEAMRRLCGWNAENGVRVLEVGGFPVVAADWKHEGELEAFMSARRDLRRAAAERGIISVQHPHPQGTVFGRHGTFPTHRRRSVAITPASDNVLVKGFDILSVHTEDDPMILSDHRMLVCRLRAKDRSI